MRNVFDYTLLKSVIYTFVKSKLEGRRTYGKKKIIQMLTSFDVIFV